MIIKILASAKNFAGIHYNEKKNDLGESELLCAENFGGLSFQPEISRADYVNYMKAISSLNPRVKYKQFHAVISVKGKQENLEYLVDAGRQYLDKMGYGKNPYLIYHHDDTANTHIHIISTRVDKNGIKIDDSFERLRSQKAMHEILSRDPTYEADHSINQALTYQFSTEAQFKLLLELQGFTIREQAGMFEVIKYGAVQRILEKEVVAARISGYNPDQQRAGQVRAIFGNYAIGLSEEQWTKLAKDKFGIDLVFHRSNEAVSPYGYTIVDHVSKNVFKGSQVLKLTELKVMASEAKVKKIVEELCASPGLSFAHLQQELADLGLKLSEHGAVSKGRTVWQLSDRRYRALKYTGRIELASSFEMNDRTCYPVLGKLLSINPKEISAALHQNEGLRVLVNYLNETGKWEEGLTYYDYTLLRHRNEMYLLSLKDRHLVHLKGLLTSLPTFDANRIPELEPTQEAQLVKSSQDNLLSILADLLPGLQHNKEDHRQRKKHRQFNK